MSFSIINQDKTKTIFIGTFDGQFEIRCTEDAEGVQSRVNKNGRTVHFVPTKSLSGFITDADKYTGEYGSHLRIFLTRDGDEYRLNLPWKGNMAGCFLACMENIDFTKAVQIDISTYNDRQYLFFKQGGNRVPAKYTKEKPNGRPAWQLAETDDGPKWNNDAERRFYQNILEEVIRPRLRNADTELLREDDPELITADDGGDLTEDFVTFNATVAKKGDTVKLVDLAMEKEPPVADDDDLPF